MNVVSALLMVLGLSLLVIVHEAGHYFVARAFGMRVLRFSIGFGKSIVEWKPEGSPTTFSIGILPVLAYVQIDGMNPVEEHDPNDPGLFPNKSLFARIATIFAGPLANYLLASLVILTVAPFGWPKLEHKSPVAVEALTPNYPAAEAGLQVGDRIVEVGGRAITNFEELVAATAPRGGQATTYIIERGGVRQPPITLTPKAEGGRGLIGVTPVAEVIYAPVPISDAAKLAVLLPYQMSIDTLKGFGKMIERRSTDGLSGPVGLAKELNKRANEGPRSYLLSLITLSIAIGLFNLLPFPALDGGRLVFLIFEAVTRRKPNERFEAVVHGIGLMLLLGLVAYVTIFKDLGLG